MKLSVLALDYDGTIARNDVMDDRVRASVAEARTAGITTLLVSGRILDELRRVTGGLHFVDGVVAENGAVLYFPDSGHTSILAPPMPTRFVDELRRRGIPHSVGQCLVDADANQAPRLLEVIRALELPLVLVFNGGRVMTMPQGVSKATGLHIALDTLRLSARNTVAVGDRENDHELLRLAEVGAAVKWGSAALVEAADVVVEGTDPSAVATYLRRLTASGRLPTPSKPRRRLLLGYTEDGREFSLAVRGRNVLVAGDAKSGKSWVAGLLCEQLIMHGYSLCVIDPEGDYRSLEALPGVTVLGGEDPPPTPRELQQALRYPDRSLVIDLSHQAQDEKIGYIRTLLADVNVLRRKTGLPHRIVVDEAHYFLHGPDALDLLDLELNGYTMVTYCASRLPKQLLDSTEVMIVTCESSPVEIEALRRRCVGCAQVDAAAWSGLGRIRVGQAIALPVTDEAEGGFRLFTIGARLTRHVRHREKYVDVPVADQRAFIFGVNGHTRRARTLREFVQELSRLPSTAVDGYLRRGDFSRWIADVFGDYALAADVRAREEAHRARPHAESAFEVLQAVRSRYELTADLGSAQA